MKTFFSVLAGLMMTSMVYAQTQPSVTINVTGNRNREVIVDGKTYTISNTSASEEQSVTINDLSIGQHTLVVARSTTSYGTSRTRTSTYFNLRDGYNLAISVASGGAVSTTETRINGGNSGIGNGKPINTAAFNRLLTQAKAKSGSSARTTFLENEFTNTNKLFTAKQASQLIVLVNSESMRLKLAKLSYTRVTDEQNFALVSNLLSSSYSKTELTNYIATVDLNDDDEDGVPMTDARFKMIYNEVYAETGTNDRYYYLTNFFGRDNNLYTSSQAAQLIQLVQGEEERFQLSKAAYRGATDKTNYTVVYNLLNSTANRNALTAYINTYGNGNNNGNVIVAMSDANYNSLYSNIYYQSSSVRYNSINSAFTTTGNYFTVAQAKKLIGLVTTESSRLALAKTSYAVLVDRSNYTQFNDLLPSTYSRNELYNYVVNYSNNGTQTGYAMNESQYNTIYQNIAGTYNTSSRVSLSSNAFANTSYYFSTDQVRRILLLISAESDRLTLAKSAFDNAVDKTNYTSLYDLFNSTVYRNDLANFIAYNGGGVTNPVAMNETDFNTINRQVQMTFGFGAKMSELTKIFNNAAYYFTVAQAKQLISLVSAEDNRLELAKSAYNNVVDRENYTLMYDLFSSQTSKNELATYISANAYTGQ